MKIKLIFVLSLLSNVVFAQIARPSFFAESKSLNPAVISDRKEGQLTLSGNILKVEKKMDYTYATSGPTLSGKSKTDIQLIEENLFRGGRGGGFTTEFSYDQVNGTKKVSSKLEGQSATNNTTKSSSSYVNLGISPSHLIGVGLTYIKYFDEFTYASDNGSFSYSSKNKADMNFLSLRTGSSIHIGPFTVGGYYDYVKLGGKNESTFTSTGLPGAPPDSTNSMKIDKKVEIVGGALAYLTPSFHTEIGYESMPFMKASPGQPKQKVPSRFTGVIEFKVKTITLGYRGSYYQNTFTDLDKIIPTQMIYDNMEGETRLENSFNFSFGFSRGFSFGVSGSYSNSKSKEKSDMLPTQDKFPVQTKSMGASAKVGYSF